MKKQHVCPNYYHGEGARGGCYVEIGAGKTPDHAQLDVGWSCVVVHQTEIPVSWLAELVAIATAHSDGIAGFLKEHGCGGPDDGSYALWVDPPKEDK